MSNKLRQNIRQPVFVIVGIIFARAFVMNCSCHRTIPHVTESVCTRPTLATVNLQSACIVTVVQKYLCLFPRSEIGYVLSYSAHAEGAQVGS
jgi:hypothetical protein